MYHFCTTDEQASNEIMLCWALNLANQTTQDKDKNLENDKNLESPPLEI